MSKLTRKPYRLTVDLAKKITKIDQMVAENHSLKLEVAALRKEKNELEKTNGFGWPTGHYYSPVHSPADLKQYKPVMQRSKESFSHSMPAFSQSKIIDEFKKISPYFKDFNYPKKDNGKSRFYSKNVSLSLLDSLTIFSMIRKHKPARIIEIGSGFSSALMMEVNEKYFDNKIDITFIEPYPELLYQRMRKDDKVKYQVIPKGVQDVPLDIFKRLQKNDILFIDSTHVSKFNSDVNYEIFYILQELNKGVVIHFHDILEGFEYPLGWLRKGWAWNEAYMLRAYLMNNKEYEVLIMTDYLANHLQELLKNAYPKTSSFYGGSLWLRKCKEPNRVERI